MMDILEQIMEERKADVAEAKKRAPLDALKERAKDRTHRSLSAKLTAPDGTKIIAEMKKASPSAGLLREDYDPEELAHIYAESGAAAVSVLTEPNHFQGCEQDLVNVRNAVRLPVLRKDFICDVYQVYETAAWGADIILLIAAGLEAGRMREIYDASLECGLEVLAEAHTADETRQVLGLEQAIVGINSRNLRTLKTDLKITEKLADVIPPDRLSIAESGIKSRFEVEQLEKLNYNGFLVGEAVLCGPDPGMVLKELIGVQNGQKA